MSRNLKIFMASGIPAGSGMAIFYSPFYGFSVGLISGLISGAFFGILMVFILGFLHGRAVKKVAHGNAEVSTGTHHVRETELPLPYERAFDLCIASLGSLGRCRVYEEDRIRGKILARTGINWKTWGDTVCFEINRIDGGSTRVKVSSRPAARMTLVDFGKNLDNVQRIISFLEKHLA